MGRFIECILSLLTVYPVIGHTSLFNVRKAVALQAVPASCRVRTPALALLLNGSQGFLCDGPMVARSTTSVSFLNS